MDRTRAVMVGCGGISAAWLRALQGMDDVEVVGLVDVRKDAAERRREEFELPNAGVDTDLAPMLRSLKPDVVFDLTVPEAHTPTTITALEHGCHVLGEKPLADSLTHAREMIEAAEKAGKLYAVMQNRRYQPEIRALRSYIASGAMGGLTTLHCDFFIGAHFGGFRDRMEHVLLLDMAIHTFDAARFIMQADPVSVYCREWNPKGSWYDHDASAVAVFEMTDGVVYTYRGSWCSEGLNTTWECDWRAIGETGSVTWNGGSDFRAQALEKRGGFFSEMRDADVPVPEDAKSGGHAGCIREFIDCVRKGQVPETVCTDNIKSLSMVFGAIESAARGARVEIDSAI